ncbi:LysM peptidoglycan-binding domain-containing M23 family metallopeptidase [Streptomyces scopuliridis]|uniref:Peptidase n=2 Tax=Streptomyces scopuliridis TaxID=452529 RepID=A0A2T7TDD8_9ACTN|nr:M23 family metallopeptidase [Streptomyces scopuliridis]PVE13157.1 peptidase [Streptomyces scopuliridis RB72]WSB32365.1 LysM peptidoglycan-binding domain-containing M23 family metallopeptidase [Streptomyces scopuliridis]WSB96610.1 LysM peptidoglycan-binding domain-containing M23 family metallopeptidase [Streptomyces scopuliridis]WSC09686.1 LysM peptidoglycan-binding domain-containing M23 family metallopeptidase [Streptomyces scopuliridis]
MPAKGKHRRPKNNPISRGFIAAGTGGAAIALPLIGATGAHAAEKAAPAVAPQAVSASAHTTATQHATRVARTYTVVAGDYLSKIAVEHHVRGGWHRLYKDNREAIGDNPSLIHPGLKLTLGGRGAAHTSSEAPAQSSSSSADSSSSGDSSSSADSADSSSSDSASSGSTDESAASTAEQAPADTAEQAPADTAAQSTGSGFTAPVDGPTSTPYRASGSSWASGYHTGVDFSASSGTPVKAVSDGTVVTAGWGGSYGNQVVIQHSDGMYSQYGHLSSLAVSAGQSVSAGEQIGLSGSTGNSTGPHLHFEIRTGPEYGSDVDPVAYLRENGVNI